MSTSTSQRCKSNFSTYSIDGNNYDEYFKFIEQIKGKELKSAPFFAKKKIGNYINDYKENYKKYKTCYDKYRYKNLTSNCKNQIQNKDNSKKILFTQLSNYSKKKTLKRINKVKNEKILKELSCYMKLLHDLLNKCGKKQYSDSPTSKDYYITVLKNEIKNKTKDEYSGNYIDDLLSKETDSSKLETFSNWDKKFKKALYEIIESYQTC